MDEAGEGLRAVRDAAFAGAVRAGVLDAVGRGLIVAAEELGHELNLVFEIGCCRLLLQRLVTVDVLEGDARKVSASMRALNRALIGTTRVQWQIEAADSSTSSEALALLLAEMER